MKYASVIVDVSNSAIDKIFDYSCPENLDIQVGSRVVVSFGKNKIQGFVVEIKNGTNYDESKIKPILELVDERPVILPDMIDLMHNMKKIYNLRTIDILRLFLPAEMREGKVAPLISDVCILNENIDIKEYKSSIRKNSKNILALIEFMEQNKIKDRTYLNNIFTNSAVNKLIENNFLLIEKINKGRKPLVEKEEKEKNILQPTQIEAVKKILSSTKPVVLHGVTGSGKTEVYMAVIESVLKTGKTAIMLVPEISLTPQTHKIFRNRFGEQVAILHSKLSVGEKFDEWQRLFNGSAKIALGARSAIFAPLQNLGAIIIDEEHDDSYSSDSNPRYITNVVAELRAKYNNAYVIYGSATPNITTYNKAMRGEYNLVEMPTRINNMELPQIQIVDMLSEIRNGNNGIFSNHMVDEINSAMKSNKQVMLFVNRRGYSSFMRCTDCGYVAKCESCDVSLVYHKVENKLKCHYCGKTYRALTNCPNCKSENIRQGAVGTQRVVDEIEKLFPDAHIFRMDHDSTVNKNAYLKILKDFANSPKSILVGTQMIAKGHDFKDVVFVGIIDADQSLFQSNYVSTEKTFQLITQVSGRAGRGEAVGKVILQTYVPKHYVYKFASNYDYKGFFKKEINIREVTQFPPFSKINRILINGKNEEKVKQIAKQCYNEMILLKNEYKNDIFYLNVMKSPLSKLKNLFRYQILIRYNITKSENIISKIYSICDSVCTSNIGIFVETDPKNLN